MDKIYLKIWKLAKPYYEKGRSYNIHHIQWIMKKADKIAEKEGLNKKLLLPIVILHDVGYAKVKEKNPNIKDKESKKIHMKAGAEIARKILEKVNYDPNLSKKIVHYVSVHDNWLFGDDTPYQECKEMAVFNDLDFLYVTSSFKAFKIFAASMQMTPQEFYQFWSKDEKLTRRPFCCQATQKMWQNSIKQIKKYVFRAQKNKSQ